MLERFSHFQKLLIEWNERVNLTAITNPADIVRKHFLDSLTLVPAILSLAGNNPVSIVDIGSGAGFPGIPLAIARPDWKICLLEATGKKVEFLNTVMSALGLSNTRAVAGRVEEIGHDPAYREQFSFAVARAVAPLSVLAEYALPFVRTGGYFIAQKGLDTLSGDILESVESSAEALNILGGSHVETKPVLFEGVSDRALVVIAKVKDTPKEYPRRPGIPAKKPL
jgi:16S rRNA (guanine527-N7)-methyltransferase